MPYPAVDIRPATPDDSRAIAELALMAGEGIPGWFWQQSCRPGQDVVAFGANKAASDTANFSWRNAHVAVVDCRIAGMLLAYPLPEHVDPSELAACPAFLRPLVELEQQVPGSFYVNMLATYDEFRGRGIGTALMQIVDDLARGSGCERVSIEVFEQNRTAMRLYRRLGFAEAARRAAVPHESHPYTGDIVLLTRAVGAA